MYIQPRYFYLIFRSVNSIIMNWVILHSVRPSFWKKRRFSHTPRCGSTESGCEISVPWWWILADLGKMTSVWSRERDTGDTSEPTRGCSISGRSRMWRKGRAHRPRFFGYILANLGDFLKNLAKIGGWCHWVSFILPIYVRTVALRWAWRTFYV